MTRSPVAILLGMAGIASCTIYALSDDVHVTPCNYLIRNGQFNSDDCDTLNSLEELDDCVIWQCNDDHRCELRSTDRDRDGFLQPACINVAARGDCDDRDAKTGPDQPELCDGKDNDCDQNIDEGMLRVQERVALSFEDDVRELAFTRNEVSRDVGVLYRAGDADAVGFGLITARSSSSGPVRMSGNQDPVRAASINVAASTTGFYANIVEAAATRRASIGSLVQTRDRILFSVDAPEQRRIGLRCASDEACAGAQAQAASDAAAPVPQIPDTTRVTLAPLEQRMLVGYARRDAERAADGCAEPDPAPRLLLNMLEQGSAGLTERTNNAVVLGEGRETRSPSLAAIEAGLVTNSRGPFGWLAGYADHSGNIIVQQVTTRADDALTSLRLELKHDGDPFLEVQILRGPIPDNNRMVIGVLARAGCDDAARLMFGLVQLTWDDTGRNELRVYRELTAIVQSGQRPSHPVLAYSRATTYWGVAYQTPDGLFAQILDSNGRPINSNAYQLTDAPPPIPDVALFASSGDPNVFFTAYSYAVHPDQSPNRVLAAHDIRTCAAATSQPSTPSPTMPPMPSPAGAPAPQTPSAPQ